MDGDSVFLLWHVHEISGEDDEKLIGAYRTRDDAEKAIQRLKVQVGFSDFPDGFEISEYKLNHDHWTEGFVSV